MQPQSKPENPTGSSGAGRGGGRRAGLLTLALSTATLIASVAGLTWFDNTLTGNTSISNADFGDVISSGQNGALIGPLSDPESA